MTSAELAETQNEDSKTETPFRRRFPRRQFNEPLGLLVRGKYFLVEGVEVGEGGMAFACDMALDKGQKVVLSFFVPRQSFVSVTSEIIYLNPTPQRKGFITYGIKYVNLDFDSQRMIRDYIADKSD